MEHDPSGQARVVDVAGLDTLVSRLAEAGYEVIGPRVRDGTIVYDRLDGAASLPAGWGDEQDGGHYRLVRRADEARFGYAVGPHSWKGTLLPARSRVFEADRSGGAYAARPVEPEPARIALLGVRPCDLAAIAVLDRVFLRDTVRDTLYASRRDDVFVVAVQCAVPGGTCFCASMGTGPGAAGGYDLCLTELLDGGHRFVVGVGSAAGAELLDGVPSRPATETDLAAAATAVSEAAGRMGRQLETEGLKEALYASLEHPRWQAVAERCLACGNCTLVCPTCFCTAVVDTSDVTGTVASRERLWDSCFTVGFSYIHGGSIRSSVRSRYRQWLTHKLAAWVDQFGTSGCVGCGRCITWCPVGIDITAEAAALREQPTGARP